MENTIITIQTDFCKVTKELLPSDVESYETCGAVLQEFVTMLVACGWQPGSVKESVIALADRYIDEEGIETI